MQKRRYYVDTCIWLNLFKKEGDASKGKPYWEIAEEFIEGISSSEETAILFTMPVLREIKFRLNNDLLYAEKEAYMMNEFRLVEIIKVDKILARKLEAESGYSISFFDCIHIAVCMRIGAVLVTRDKKLIAFAKKYISAYRPEELKQVVKPFYTPFLF